MAEHTRATTLRLRVRLQPRASRDRIVGWHGTALKIQVHAPPAENAANAALVDMLARTLAVPRRAVHIVHGGASRDKVIEIGGVDPAVCQRRLDAVLQALVDKGRSHG
jgi:uncharacterized protein (TIGR00251 family)